ncbi:MAG: hypothetical protein RLZZ386_1529, partial [Planctomycetota bacterium]
MVPEIAVDDLLHALHIDMKGWAVLC